MNTSWVKSVLKKGEGVAVEFKECNTAINKDVYETVCAFLNRNGGELLLGVNDNGSINGIDEKHLLRIKKDFVTAVNNPQKISPAFYLSIEEITIDRKTILYVYIPESSQVHRCNGKLFDRNEDGDLNITDHHNLVAALYQRKQVAYSENTIYPFIELADLRSDLIVRVRKLAALQHFKIDAILRRDNMDRYDDRDDIRTNLIDCYDRLIHFGEKHLNDPFYLENDQRISLRGKILREIISNLLIHREYTNAFPARFIIERDKIQAENGNKPHGFGRIRSENLIPFPKNPSIARVFKEIGRADELGSGTRNLFKYCSAYCGHDPELFEEDIFRFTLSLTPQVTPQVTPQDERTQKIVAFCTTPRNRREIQDFLGLKDREHFRIEILNYLLGQGLLHPTIPDKLSSPRQKYYSGKARTSS